MTRAEARLLHVSSALVCATGVVYAWMCYFARSDDPFAVVNHPWQPAVQHLHILVAPLLVFACGLIWQAHVWLRVRSKFEPRRKSGLALVCSLAPMVISGYAIQVVEHETFRNAWVVLHVVTSCAWLVAYAIHPWNAWRTRGRAVASEPHRSSRPATERAIMHPRPDDAQPRAGRRRD